MSDHPLILHTYRGNFEGADAECNYFNERDYMWSFSFVDKVYCSYAFSYCYNIVRRRRSPREPSWEPLSPPCPLPITIPISSIAPARVMRTHLSYFILNLCCNCNCVHELIFIVTVYNYEIIWFSYFLQPSTDLSTELYRVDRYRR